MGSGCFFGFVWMAAVRRKRYVAVTDHVWSGTSGPEPTFATVVVAELQIPRSRR